MSPRSSDSADVKVAVCNMRLQVFTCNNPRVSSTAGLSCMQHASQHTPADAGTLALVQHQQCSPPTGFSAHWFPHGHTAAPNHQPVVTGARMAQVTYLSEREHWTAYLAAPAASDMYEYGVLSSTRWRWLDERQREIVPRWLEATTPSIPGIVSQACGY